MQTFLLVLLGLIAALIGGGWLGLRRQPDSFPPYPQRTPPLGTIPLPADLPAPVARYYRAATGDAIPVVTSAVVTGRGAVRRMGLRFPARFRFTHIAGQGYRHYMEATIFGRPLLRVNEWYLDGKSRLELPFAVEDNLPKVNSGANLGLWGESMWLPGIFLTDPRVRWEAIDEHSARLVVPEGEGEDSFIVRFDPATGLLRQMEAQRWQGEKSESKLRWTLDVLGWVRIDGNLIPSPGTATWADTGVPWLEMVVEDVVYNVDVSEYIRARGL